MISDFGALLSFTLQAFSMEFTIYGFTFSFWQVFLFFLLICHCGSSVLRFPSMTHLDIGVCFGRKKYAHRTVMVGWAFSRLSYLILAA